MIYAGIGSRDTPDDILDQFEYLGEWLGVRGHILKNLREKSHVALARGMNREHEKV